MNASFDNPALAKAIRKAKEIHERYLRELAARAEFNPFEACPGCEGAPLEETNDD